MITFGTSTAFLIPPTEKVRPNAGLTRQIWKPAPAIGQRESGVDFPHGLDHGKQALHLARM
jgi:hypothetical protein